MLRDAASLYFYGNLYKKVRGCVVIRDSPSFLYQR